MLNYKFFRMTLSIFASFVLLFCLAGCSQNDDAEFKQREKITSDYDMYAIKGRSNMLKGLENPRTEQSSRAITSGMEPFSDTTDTTPATTLHTNEYVYYWPDVSNAVDNLKGIAKAHVFVTNKNAYVGIMFTDEQYAQTTKKKGYDDFHRHEVAPRSLAAMPYDHFYTVENNATITNQVYHDVGRLVNNYAAPRQVFISADHTFLHHLSDLAKLDKQQLSLQPYLHEFNILVQHYFSEGQKEPTLLNGN